MARKKKNQHINLNNGPLKSVTIGEIKENKHGFLGVLFLLGLFIGLIYFLPDIQKYYEQYFKPVNSDVIVPDNTDNQEESEQTEEEEDDTKYMLSETKQYLMDEIEVNNINFTEEGLLTFQVKNKTDNQINLNEKNIYFLTFDESGTLLNFVPINGILNVDQDLSFNYSIKSQSHSFEIKQMNEEDYPYFNINVDSDGVSKLTCSKNSDKIVFTFKNEKLDKIEHTANYEKTNESYDSIYSTYNSMVTNNRNKQGITANISSDDTSMNYSMTIDYALFNETLSYKYYLPKETSPRVVNFKLESDLFDCM